MHAGDRPACRTRATGWVAIAVALLALALTGCSSAVDQTELTSSGTRLTTCPQEYPIRLPISTRAVAGVPPLYRLRACAADAKRGPVLLVNNGNAAWATIAPGHELNMVQGNEQATWLREHVALPIGLVLPGTAIVVRARPSQVTWSLSREWTVGWASLQAGMNALAPQGRDSSAAAMAAGSPRGRGLVSCALSAYHLYRTAHGDPLSAHDGLGALDLTWSADPGPCSADWQEADKVLAAHGARPVTWSLAVLRADAWVGRSRGTLGWLADFAPVVIGVR